MLIMSASIHQVAFFCANIIIGKKRRWIAQVPKTEEGKEIRRESEMELSLRLVNVPCDALSVKCNVVEKSDCMFYNFGQ